MGALEYSNGALEAIYHEEGRALKQGNTFEQQYNLKDHLGNTRVVFENNNGVAEIVSQSAYYPFGMEMEGLSKQTSPLYSYLYNGKELDADFGLGWYHYGKRIYNAQTGRFTSVDPIADQFAFVSPFNYAENEPIANIDLHGLQIFSFKRFVEASVAYAAGVSNAVYANAVGDYPEARKDPSEFGDLSDVAAAGQTTGDVISLIGGAGATVLSLMGLAGEGIFAIPSGGTTSLAVPATVAVGVQGSISAANGLKNLMSSDDIPKPPTGRGSVPPNERDPKRTYTKSERQEMLDDQGGVCAQCKETKTVEQVDGHHKERHADGGKTNKENGAAVCKDCHKKLHGKDE